MLPSSRPRICSFITRLIGGDSQTLYRPITSPYTSRILKPFIRRDNESKPMKLQLLQQIIAHGHRWIFFAFFMQFCLVGEFVWFRVCDLTAAQCTPEGSVWHYWNSNKAVDCITCFNLDDIGWDFISVSDLLIRHDPEWKPPPVSSIDYCYVQPHHIPSVNAMCREFFWPGIDCKF